jgi:fatty-acyl-CoA synthase
MAAWNFADVFEIVADELPDAPAQVRGDRRQTWSQLDQRADGVARAFLDAGAAHQDKVANYLYNGPDYLEAVIATTKAGLVPVNTNYRYGPEELIYLWDNADATAVVFHGSFTETIEKLRDRVPKVKIWLWVDDDAGSCPEWAVPYEEVATTRPGRTFGAKARSGDDIYMLYTGGTTGMPKGVMWRQEDLLQVFFSVSFTDLIGRPIEELRAKLTGPGPVSLPACPLMHGTGSFISYMGMVQGGSVVTLVSRSLDIEELLTTIEREGATNLAIVGDAFAKPMLRALDDNPGKWDISSLNVIASSGVMWSEATKQGLLKHHTGMLLSDGFSSSEALGMGSSISSASDTAATAKFTLGPNARVLTEDGRDVVPGSGEVGMMAVTGVQPIGYYKDDEKTARTFKIIDGKRYSIPGDYATIEEDGSIRLLGRGSVCINTGGEKVFPEEVEEVLKEHPAVRDAAVVGVPDERFGEAITALVELHPDASTDEGDIVAHVKGRLAGYKAPKRVFTVATIGRSPSGKVDYARLKQEATSLSGVSG